MAILGAPVERPSWVLTRRRLALRTMIASLTAILCLEGIGSGTAEGKESRDRPAGAIPPTMFELASRNPEIQTLLRRAIYLEEEQGDYAAAIAKYMEILKIEPNNPAALNTVAGLYGKLENYGEEVMWAGKAVAAAPRFFPAYINLGNGYVGLGDLDHAYEAHSRAVEIYPSDPVGYYSLGVIEDRREDWKQAAYWYGRSIEVDPKFVKGHFNLAAAYANQGEYAMAIHELDRVLALDPLAEDAKAMLSDLRNRQK